MPSRRFTSGRKFSTTTSAFFTILRSAARPSLDFRLSVMLRLLRCRFWKSKPSRGPPGASPPFSSGGTADVLTRLVADQLSATFKQQFFVETRAGAAGTIGVKSVADAAPDGYNFALTNITHLVLAPISNPKLGYDPKRDLTNIGY